MRRVQGGLSTLFMVITLLAIASLVLLATSRQLVLEHANAQNQHRYHQALNYAEEGLKQALADLAANKASVNSARYRITLPPPDGTLQRVVSTGSYDGQQVSVQRLVRRVAGKPPAAAVSIVGDLVLSGSIQVLGGDNATFNVDGNVNLSGSVVGIHALTSTGNVLITGNQTLDSLHANGDVEISNGSYQLIKSAGKLTLRGAAQVHTLARANGNAILHNSGALKRAEVLGDVDVNMGGAQLAQLESMGSVQIQQVGGIDQLLVQNNLSVNGWGAPMAGTVGGHASYNPANSSIRIRQDPKLRLALEPVARVQLARPRPDAFDYKGEAHYRFEYDQQGKMLITVRLVHGLSDGQYRLGLAADTGQPNYLCRGLDSQGRCQAGLPATLLCKGHSPQSDCFSGSRPGHWQLNGITLAPGVLWFDGDLNVGNGSYHNSFIASGHIGTSGQHVSYAVNYAAAAGICRNADFPTLYPSDDCSSSGVFKGRPVGNIVMLAGGYRAGVFQGGNITLGASSQVYGNVWAGNLLSCGGSTLIHGYVAAARQGSTGQAPHQWSGSTTIDLRQLPPSFTPEAPPGSGEAGAGSVQPLPHSWIDSEVLP